MWVRSAAIRPIPPYSEVPAEAVADAERRLVDEGADAEQHLREAFDRFERSQPALADHIGRTLGRTRDEVALALGTFLSVAVWLSFDATFGTRLASVNDTEVAAVDESFALDEELRGTDPAEALDSDDVVAMEQPHLIEFIHGHIDAALEADAERADVDAVHATYRMVLVEILVLSYAVAPPTSFVGSSAEICA